MNDELRKLLDELSRTLGDAARNSPEVRDVLKKLEEGGYDARVTLALILGVKGQHTEIQQVFYGTDSTKVQRAAARRISAFDKRFLRALKIQLPD